MALAGPAVQAVTAPERRGAASGIVIAGVGFGKTVGRAESQARQVREGRARLDAAGVPVEVCELVAKMLAYEVADRPSAREVERMCREARGRVAGPWLRDWAEDTIPAMLVGRGLGGDHDFSDAIVSERSGPSTSDTIALEIEGAAAAPVAKLAAAGALNPAPPKDSAKAESAAKPVAAKPVAAKAGAAKPVAAKPSAGAEIPKPPVVRPKPAPQPEGAGPVTWLLGISSVVLVPAAILVFLWFVMLCCCGGFGGEV
jgi:hypothetical protein